MKAPIMSILVFAALTLPFGHASAADTISASDVIRVAEKDGKVTHEELKVIAVIGPEATNGLSSSAKTEELREWARKADDLLTADTKRSKAAVDYFAQYSAELYLAQALNNPSFAVRLYALPAMKNCVTDLSLGVLLSSYERLIQEQVKLDGGEHNAAARDIERGLVSMIQNIMVKHGVKTGNVDDLLVAAREWWKNNADAVQSQARTTALRRIETQVTDSP